MPLPSCSQKDNEAAGIRKYFRDRYDAPLGSQQYGGRSGTPVTQCVVTVEQVRQNRLYGIMTTLLHEYVYVLIPDCMQ